MKTPISHDALQTLNDNSQEIASWSNGQTRGDLYWLSVSLYRHQNGKYYLREFGGTGVNVNNGPQWITREASVDWVAIIATDPVTGYGYTREQAELMVDGKDAGKGYRDNA